MIDFEKELMNILADDPLNLLESKPKPSSVIPADERLINSFQEINDFIRENGKNPSKEGDMGEYSLWIRLEGIKENPEKSTALKDYDDFFLLQNIAAPEIENISTIDDVIGKDHLGLLDSEDNSSDIFDLKHVPKAKKEMPDFIASRKPCKDFNKFKHLFEACRLDLSLGKRKTKLFSKEQQISKGHFFILNGIILYVAKVGDKERVKGKPNARLQCIFENGTESNMLLRSLATALYKDKTGRRIMESNENILDTFDNVDAEDKVNGYIYILKSESNRPNIKSIKNLYKVGFSTLPVAERIKNARKEPTFLMSNVSIEWSCECYNINPQKLENLLHKFFARVCLDLEIEDDNGQKHKPREWFIVPISVIIEAISYILKKEIMNFQYDAGKEEIVKIFEYN